MKSPEYSFFVQGTQARHAVLASETSVCLPRRSGMFGKLLPHGVAAAEMLGEGNPAFLAAAERRLIGQAATGRISEFAAGRICARHAAAEFGIFGVAIPILEDRRPCWPHSLTGSITHTDGFTAAAVGEKSQFLAIGIDAEKIMRLPGEILSRVLLPEEQSWVDNRPESEHALATTLMFSAKEAFYKCQYEVTGQWLEFKDIALVPANDKLVSGSFSVRPVCRVKLFERVACKAVVHFASTGDMVLTAMSIASPDKRVTTEYHRKVPSRYRGSRFHPGAQVPDSNNPCHMAA